MAGSSLTNMTANRSSAGTSNFGSCEIHVRRVQDHDVDVAIYPYAILDIQPGADAMEASSMFGERMMPILVPEQVALRVENGGVCPDLRSESGDAGRGAIPPHGPRPICRDHGHAGDRGNARSGAADSAHLPGAE